MKTSEPTTQIHIQGTLFAEVFPVNQSQTQASAKGSQRLHNLVCGTNSIESFAYYDRDTSSWKTCQQSFLEDLESFLETWPRQGITVNGVAYQHRMLEPVTRETGFGLLPTIRASEPGSTNHGYGDSLKEGICKQIGIPTKKYPLLPTPMARDWKGRSGQGFQDRSGGKPRQLPDALTQTGQSMHLNPSFVEEMMGYPIGYTDLKH